MPQRPWIDARLPVRFGSPGSRLEGEAVLTDAALDGPAAGAMPHALGCACCLPRNAAATALAALYRERAMGAAIRGVLVAAGAAGEAAVREALASDPVASARFRLATPG